MQNTKPTGKTFSAKRINTFHWLGILIACSVVFSSCESDNDIVPVKQPTITLMSNAVVGNYLADSLGFTVYSFANDADGLNNCTGGCTTLWPVYYAGDNLVQEKLGIGLDIADFSTITTAAGVKQTTYKSWPLYHYAPVTAGANQRENAGEIRGEGIAGFWHVAKPDYTIRLINAQLVGQDGRNYKSDYTEGIGKTLYFSDPNGTTIYRFSKDSFNINKFTRADFSDNTTWPIYEKDQVVVPSTLDKTLFGSITVFGRKQLTYKGWPMYNFGADNRVRGSNKGVSFGAPGIWPVAVQGMLAAPKP